MKKKDALEACLDELMTKGDTDWILMATEGTGWIPSDRAYRRTGLAEIIEDLLFAYFPALNDADSLDPQETVEQLLELYADVHEKTVE